MALTGLDRQFICCKSSYGSIVALTVDVTSLCDKSGHKKAPVEVTCRVLFFETAGTPIEWFFITPPLCCIHQITKLQIMCIYTKYSYNTTAYVCLLYDCLVLSHISLYFKSIGKSFRVMNRSASYRSCHRAVPLVLTCVSSSFYRRISIRHYIEMQPVSSHLYLWSVNNVWSRSTCMYCEYLTMTVLLMSFASQNIEED